MAFVLTGCAASPQAVTDDVATPVEVLLYAESTRPDELKRIVVPVMLNDTGPFYFLLDTGATRTVITQSAATRLALAMDEQRRVGIRGVGGVLRVPTVVMQSLQVGALQSTQVRMPVLSGFVIEGMDGILGMDILGDTRIKADFLNNQVQITTANGLSADKDRMVIAFNQVGRRPIMVDAWVGGIRTRAIVDTGCAHTLGNAALLKALQQRLQTQLITHPSDITDAAGTDVQAQTAMVPQVIIGAAGVRNLYVSFGEFSVFDTWAINDGPALLIGMDVLSLLKELTIDYRRKELQIAMMGGHD